MNVTSDCGTAKNIVILLKDGKAVGTVSALLLSTICTKTVSCNILKQSDVAIFFRIRFDCLRNHVKRGIEILIRTIRDIR